MNVVASMLIGALLGWLANNFIQPEHPRGLTNSLLLGVIGALVGNWVASPAVGAGAEFSSVGLVMAAGGAVAWLTVLHLMRRIRED